MDGLPDPLEPWMIGALVLVVAVFVVAGVVRGRKSSEDSKHSARVREMVARGDFQGAARIQLAAGRKLEAFNLLDRGKVHGEAAVLAEELKMFSKAAEHAEKNKDFAHAARLYEKSGDFSNAGRLFQRSGDFQNAAEAMEKDPDVSIETLAKMWENACLELMPAPGSTQTLPPEEIKQVLLYARKAAESYKKAGDNEKASVFFDICQDREEAERMRGRSTQVVLHKMTQRAGGLSSGEHSTRALLSDMQGGEQLGALRDLVQLAVTEAVQKQSPSVVVQAGADLSKTGIDLSRANVVYVRDAMAGEATAVARETDRYTIHEKLGEGGMAVVYRATDRNLDREVALKFLPEGLTTSAGSLKLFEREARAAAAIVHANVVTIFDFGSINGRAFICMELVEGYSLEERLEQRDNQGLELGEFLDACEGVLTALHAAHSRGFVHRDIKPSNIMINQDGVVKLMDFGIASALDPKKSTQVIGTPLYMAPEQFQGKGIDERSDLFALGVSLYELWTGKMPYVSMMRFALPEKDQPIHLRAGLPSALNTLIWKMIHPDVDQRPKSTEDALRVVRSIQRHAREEMMGSFWDNAGEVAHVEDTHAKLDSSLDEVLSLEAFEDPEPLQNLSISQQIPADLGLDLPDMDDPFSEHESGMDELLGFLPEGDECVTTGNFVPPSSGSFVPPSMRSDPKAPVQKPGQYLVVRDKSTRSHDHLHEEAAPVRHHRIVPGSEEALKRIEDDEQALKVDDLLKEYLRNSS